MSSLHLQFTDYSESSTAADDNIDIEYCSYE